MTTITIKTAPITRLEVALRMSDATREDIAAAAGLTRETIYRIARGSSEPKWKTAKRLSKALGLDVDMILDQRKYSTWEIEMKTSGVNPADGSDDDRQAEHDAA